MIKPFRVYNNVTKVYIFWQVGETRIGLPNMVALLGVAAVTGLLAFLGSTIHTFVMIGVFIIGALVGLKIFLVTSEMGKYSKLPTWQQYTMMREEAKNPVVDNYTYLLEDDEE